MTHPPDHNYAFLDTTPAKSAEEIERALLELSRYLELRRFVSESNRIEGIFRDPTDTELQAHRDLLKIKKMTVAALLRFVEVVEPEAKLRIEEGMNVKVGGRKAPPGGAHIQTALVDLLGLVNRKQLTPLLAHLAYELLHPFSDGNGRSGRALWLWMKGGSAPLGFLHSTYYDVLDREAFLMEKRDG